MPAAVASRARTSAGSAKAPRDALPPAKKTKLSQPASTPGQNGLGALLNGTRGHKPTVAAKMNGVKNNRRDRVNEATAVVRGGHSGHGDVDMVDAKNIIDISSAEEDSNVSSSEDDNAEATQPVANGHVDEDQPIEHDAADEEEPSFGERLRAQEPDPDQPSHLIDVEAAFAGPDAESRALATAAINQPLAAPSATSLGTVLAQALRTNDQELLDSCLRVNDVDTVYATIERLPSPLVGTLLQKVAERLHKRPGRPGMLMVWVQWSLSAHGGYLATQPQLVKQLATLNKVLKERASGLQPLLALKGRLDMLHTQLELRRRNQRRAAKDEIDEAVIYVEGEEEPSSADEEDEVDRESDGDVEGSKKRIRQDLDEEGESSVDEMPTTMEIHEDEEDGSEDSDDLIDDEAEETDDTGDDMSEPMSDDLEDEGISESEEEESRPAKRSTAARAGLSRRY